MVVGISSSLSLLDLGVLVLLPALGHSLPSCNGVQGLSTPELLSLPLSSCPDAALLPEEGNQPCLHLPVEELQ